MRSMITRFAVAVAVALSAPAALHAQFAGKWALVPGDGAASPQTTTQQAGGRQMMVRQSFPAHSMLDLRVKGDSLFGTWTPTEPAQPPVEVKGKTTGNQIQLRGTREAHALMNGEAQTVVMVLVFDLTRAQDNLSGTMKTTTESGQRVLSSLNVKGSRAR